MSEKIDTKGWTPEQIAALEKAQEERDLQAAELETYEAAERARRASPEYLIQKLTEEAAETRERREAAEREATGERELAKARKKYGRENVALIPTLRGPIILRKAEQKEIDDNDARIEGLAGRPADVQKAWQDFSADLVVYPDRETFLKIMAEFYGTWSVIWGVREALTTATRDATAKKG